MRQGVLWTSIPQVLLLALLVVACGPGQIPAPEEMAAGTAGPNSALSPTVLQGKLIIFHAGSLTSPMQALTEAFQAQHSLVTLQTEGSGSREAARKISELGREADLMVSADYTVINNLLIPDFADWNIQFARNTMVIAYTDNSNYAAEIDADNWYEILSRDGVICGRSDPDADPCGYRALMVWQLAEKHYGVPGLYSTLEEHCPREYVRPKEVELIALLQSGDMDYAFEYRSLAVQHGLRFVELPDEINLGRVEYADSYRQARVEVSGAQPGTTLTQVGSPIVYGVTIPRNAPSPDLAVEFVKFLIGPEGQAIMEQQGQPPIVPPVASERDAFPFALQALVK